MDGFYVGRTIPDAPPGSGGGSNFLGEIDGGQPDTVYLDNQVIDAGEV